MYARQQQQSCQTAQHSLWYIIAICDQCDLQETNKSRMRCLGKIMSSIRGGTKAFIEDSTLTRLMDNKYSIMEEGWSKAT